MTALDALGWDAGLEAAFAPHAAAGLVPARIAREERGAYVAIAPEGETGASLAGRLRYEASTGAEAAMPAVGDWVALSPSVAGGDAVVRAVLPRRTAIVRRGPSDRSVPTQVLAANVDVAFVVTSLNAEFNPRRLERYLATAWESGARPVVVLSKADLVADASGVLAEAVATAPGTEVLAVSSLTGDGVERVRGLLGPGRTAVFLGSSGVGKSTLVNALAGEARLVTSAIREDDARGRHTTTRRQLLALADGVVIDTPGLRELALADGDGLGAAFADVEAIATRCRFRDCSHESEPGCAVRDALRSGGLDRERFTGYRKLEREAHRAAMETDANLRRAERRKWTAISKSVGAKMRAKYGDDR